MRLRGAVALCLAMSFGLAGVPALAVGPVEGEVGAAWWANSFSASGNGSEVSSDAGAPGFRAELWFFERYGLRAERYSSNLDEFDAATSDYTSLDFRWRAFSPTRNNFIAIDAGWQQLDLGTLGLDGATSGARVGLEGRLAAARAVYFYGQGFYFPDLRDTNAADPAQGQFRDMSGYAYEAGISWMIFPFLSFRGGYRGQRIDFTRTGYIASPGDEPAIEGATESNGFLVGLSFCF